MNRVVSLVCLGILASALVAVPRPAHAGPKPTVAILGLELKDDGTGIDERSANIARLLTEALRKRAKAQTGPYTLAPGGDKELVDAVLLAGCDSPDKECMTKIGADMATDFLIYGRMEKAKDKGFQVSLTLLDVSKKDRVRQMTETILGSETGQVDLERWGKTMYGRLAGESTKGTLVVTANVDSGSVFVDDQPKGNLVQKQARIQGLDEGRKRVRVESPGWSSIDTVVTINGGETAETTVTLKKIVDAGGTGTVKPGGPGNTDGGTGNNIYTTGSVSHDKPGGFWRKTAIASGVVALAAGGVWFYAYKQVDDANSTLCNEDHASDPGCPGRAPPAGSNEWHAADDQGKRWSTRSYIAAPLTIAAGGLFVFAVVKGFVFPGKADPESSGVTLHQNGKKRLSVTPVIGPDGAAATLRFDW